jgi:peptidoglycan/LPS O-acetylase OafA/YrhL
VERAGQQVGDGVGNVQRTISYEPGLDGLRAVSILGVLAYHACATSELSGWFRGGNLGVSVFFTLSGYLITTLLLTEITSAGTIDLGRFWSRRIRRLAPASLVVISAVIVFSHTSLFDVRASDAIAATWSATNWHVIASGQDKLLQTIVGPLGPTWSLAVEEQFYIGLAIALAVGARARRPHVALSAIFGLTVVASLVVANVSSDWSPRLEFGTDVRAAEVAIGGLLALFVHCGGRVWTAMRHSKRLLDTVGWLALGALVALFLAADYSPPWLLRGGFSVIALVSSAVLFAVLGHGSMSRVLSWPPLVAVGRWSYSLYLVHWPVFLALSVDRVGFDGLGLVWVKIAAAGVIAVLLHRVIEQPIRRATWAPRATVLAWIGASLAVTILAATTLP